MTRVEIDLSEHADEIEGLTQDVLLEVANILVNELKREAPSGATGDLIRQTQIWQTEPGRIIITMPDYARWVQEGRRPTGDPLMIPWTPILLWTRRVLKGDEQMASQIRAKIAAEGTRPNPYIDRAIDNTMGQFQ